MSEEKYLTPEEVSARYRGIALGTLANWRANRVGPSYLRCGKAVLYPVASLDAWDKKNLVTCSGSKSHKEEALP
jgi:hypothetical protein